MIRAATEDGDGDELSRLADERVRDARDLVAGGLPFQEACRIAGADPDDCRRVTGSPHPAPSPSQIAQRAAEIRRGWTFATERARYTLGPERRTSFPGFEGSGIRELPEPTDAS